MLIDVSTIFTIGASPDLRLSAKLDPQDSTIFDHVGTDHWISELMGFGSFAWAALQTTVSDYAVGRTVRAAGTESFVIQPNGTGDSQLCGSQKMRKMGGFV